ncbi:Gfo/Idh/MocA family protein [Streptomyces sp. MMS24-I2-30]|uniref:Gfo/Idh/MocA family protein n=1 Tax=Streptomyces sp. MMS24-I2-30 TaxID=3351564 RepID=UPI0038969E92
MKVAVLSFAHASAATYVRLLRALPGVDVVTADPDGPPGDPARGRSMAERLGAPYAGGWDEVFALRPDAVVVTSEIARRRELVERAAGVGAQVLCEHPLAPKETDAQAMVDACADAGVRLTLASPSCFSPAFSAVCRAIADGDVVGELMTIHGAYHTTGRSATQEPADGGALAANAAVLLDMVDTVLGGEPAEQVYAQANSILDGGPGVESAAFVSVRYSSGTVAAVDCSWSLCDNRPGGPTMTFVGDRGSLELNTTPRLLSGFESATVGEWWDTGGPDVNSVMLSEFIAAVGEGHGAGSDGAAGVRMLRIIQAAYESVHTGRPVDLAVPLASGRA